MVHNRDSYHWESSLKIDLPEFQGSLTLEEFLGYFNAIDEILDFKEVPKERRVPLLATKFRRKAFVRWQQLRLTRQRQGKTKINSWIN